MKVQFTAKSLAEVGVELVSEHPATLKCMVCDVVWSPKIGPDAKLPDGWWHCTNNGEHNEKFNIGYRDASKKKGRVTSEYLSTLPDDYVRAYRLGFQAGSK